MTAYYFHMPDVPRTINREEWYKIWQEVRRRRKEVAAWNISRSNLLTIELPDYMRKDIIEHLINPPLILGPYMNRGFDPTKDVIR